MNLNMKVTIKELLTNLSPQARDVLITNLMPITQKVIIEKDQSVLNENINDLFFNIDRQLTNIGNDYILLLRDLRNSADELELLAINPVNTSESIAELDKNTELEAKLIVKGVQLIDFYNSIGIVDFGEMACDASIRFDQISKSFLKALKKSYIFALITNKDLSTSYIEVNNYKFKKLLDLIQSKLQAKFISNGMQVMEKYIKKDILEFSDMIKHAFLDFGNFTQTFLTSMKIVYVTKLVTCPKLTSQFDDVLSFTLDDLIESFNNHIDEKEMLIYTLMIHLKECVPHTFNSFIKENYLVEYINKRVNSCLQEIKMYQEKSNMNKIEAREVAISGMLGLL